MRHLMDEKGGKFAYLIRTASLSPQMQVVTEKRVRVTRCAFSGCGKNLGYWLGAP
jgi:hypothetical protein